VIERDVLLENDDEMLDRRCSVPALPTLAVPTLAVPTLLVALAVPTLAAPTLLVALANRGADRPSENSRYSQKS
jgi:hypothetical protein